LRKAVNSIYALRPTIDIALASKNKFDFAAYFYQKLMKPLQNAYWSSFILREQRDTFFEIFKELHSSLESIKTSAIAIAIGENSEVQYPIHLLSYESIPEGVFAESDTHPVRTIDTESIKVDDIANAQWKEASERYELQEGVEWHCVEGAYRKFTLVRCIADNPNVGTVREQYFLKPRAAEDQPNTEGPSRL
jgi:hypothetical protein